MANTSGNWEWFGGGDPWLRFQLDRSNGDGANDLRRWRPYLSIINDVSSWPWPPLTSHKSAGHPLHLLVFLSETGLTEEALGLGKVTESLLDAIKDDAIPRVPVKFSRSQECANGPLMSWAICDAPLTAYALIGLGHGNDPRIKKAVSTMASMTRENGWPCIVCKDLGDFRGPGKKDDPCPYATLIMLKLLSVVPGRSSEEAAKIGTECLLDLWTASRERHPFMFYMGTDFRKLKAPTIWYDILSVVDVLGRFHWTRDDPRLLEMAHTIRSKADSNGRYTPESVWQYWKEWDFGQKKEPSRDLTFMVERALARLE